MLRIRYQYANRLINSLYYYVCLVQPMISWKTKLSFLIERMQNRLYKCITAMSMQMVITAMSMQMVIGKAVIVTSLFYNKEVSPQDLSVVLITFEAMYILQ